MLRNFLAIPLLALAACTQPTSNGAIDSPEQSGPQSPVDYAAELGTESLAHKFTVVDTHIDVPYRLHRNWVDITQASEIGEFDYPRAVAGGLDAAFMSIFIPATTDAEGRATELANELIDSVERLTARAPDKFQIATCVEDIHNIRNAGRIALPMGMENGAPIAGAMSNLDHFRHRGIRYITLAHSKWNHISDSSYDADEHWQGLSDFGKSLIQAMNERGVMIDVSHISDRAFWQVLALSEVPVIASHSSLRHFVPGFHRNMSDEMVAALKDNGGVVQINFGSTFVTSEARTFMTNVSNATDAFQQARELASTDLALAEFRIQYIQEHKFPFASIGDVLDHIDRAVMLAGIDHVGLGSDFDGVGPTLPINLKDVGDLPNLIDGLVGRGYSEADIEKIVGGNLLRVWAEVEAHATRSGYPPLCRRV